MIFPLFTPTLPRTPTPPPPALLFCAWIFYLSYSLGTLQSNKPPSFSPVLDLEPKLETAWLEPRGGSQERGRCGYWTEQIAPLQSAFYPRTPRLKYPRSSPSNHGFACFPLIIYLVARRCFLPHFVTFWKTLGSQKVNAGCAEAERRRYVASDAGCASPKV